MCIICAQCEHVGRREQGGRTGGRVHTCTYMVRERALAPQRLGGREDLAGRLLSLRPPHQLLVRDVAFRCVWCVGRGLCQCQQADRPTRAFFHLLCDVHPQTDHRISHRACWAPAPETAAASPRRARRGPCRRRRRCDVVVAPHTHRINKQISKKGSKEPTYQPCTHQARRCTYLPSSCSA